MLEPVVAEIESSASTLVFTNTRSQAELWYQALLEARPEWAGVIALHHGSLDASVRAWVEAGLKAGRLKAVVKWGVGVDNVDFAAARDLGIPAVNTPGVFGREVADIAMNYVSGLARHTFFIDRSIRTENAWPKPAGISLAGRTAALVGHGDIGSNVARRLLAADMQVNVYDPAFQPEQNPALSARTWPEGLAEADFLVFTCPLLPATFHMFSAEIVPLLKPGVRVVNVGRGPVIDEAALIAAQQSGIVHSVALDVFETEPLPADSPLRGHDFNIFGSHNASNTIDAVLRVSHQAIALLFASLGIGQ
jgi:D-3-phosphoglycerate dehydrogenase